MKNNFPFLIYRSAEEDISVDAFIKDDTIWGVDGADRGDLSRGDAGLCGGALRRHHRPGQPVFVGFYHEAAAAAGQRPAHRADGHCQLPGRQPGGGGGKAVRHRTCPCQPGRGPLHHLYAGHGAGHAAADRAVVPALTR